jgi:hypothetical protein
VPPNPLIIHTHPPKTTCHIQHILTPHQEGINQDLFIPRFTATSLRDTLRKMRKRERCERESSILVKEKETGRSPTVIIEIANKIR